MERNVSVLHAPFQSRVSDRLFFSKGVFLRFRNPKKLDAHHLNKTEARTMICLETIIDNAVESVVLVPVDATRSFSIAHKECKPVR